MASESYGHIAARSRLRDKLSPRNQLKTKAEIASGLEGDGLDHAARVEGMWACTLSGSLSLP